MEVMVKRNNFLKIFFLRKIDGTIKKIKTNFES